MKPLVQSIRRDWPAPPATAVASTALFGSARELRIRHRSEEYRLRITKQGKLILTK